ncbi:MAG: DUF4012 domain-containing protein [Patescibacteria group bacterium]
MSKLFTLENFSKNIRVLITRVGLPLGREIENKLKDLKKFEITSCQNPSPNLINEEPFDVVIHLAGFDPPSFAETLYHTSILHQLLDLCLKHKAKFILVLPTQNTSLKEVAVSLVSQFHKLFSVNYELVELGEKDLLSDAADEVIKKFVHRTHLQKLKKAPAEEIIDKPKIKVPVPKRLIIVLILIGIIPMGIFGWRMAGKKLLACSLRSLQKGSWVQSQKCAKGAMTLGSSTKIAKLYFDLAKVGELGGRLLSGRSEDLENFSGELSYARERIAQVQIEVTDEPTRILLAGARELLTRLKYVTADAGVLMGTTKSVNYLILIQDAFELRPTGGFIEGVALLMVSAGKIENVQLLTALTADGLLKGTVTPPEDLQIATGEQAWYLRDSNWDPDFPKTARQTAWFIEKQLHKSTDIVVGLNTRTLAKVLEITGPVNVSGEPREINAGNFLTLGLSKSSADPATRNFYLDVFGAVLTKLQAMSPDKLGQLGSVVLDGLETKQLMISPVGETALPNIVATGWSGNLAPDSIYMVSSNVGINKANSSVDQKTLVDVSLSGSIAEISLSTVFTNKAPGNTWPTGNYKNYLRFYLPSDVSINRIVVNNKPLGPESIRTTSTSEFIEVGIMVNIPASQEVTAGINFSRKLPEISRFTYTLNIPNQPGLGTGSLGVTLRYPPTWLAQTAKPAAVAAAGLLRYNGDISKPFKMSADFLKHD